MKNLRNFTLLALLLNGSPILAGETPQPTAQDNRIREVIFDENQVFRIVGVFRSATQIVFSPGERVEHVALGDTISWEVAPAENSLFIKPRERAGPTNLIVITRSNTGNRTYTFELSARRGSIGERTTDTFFKVAFRYPREEAAAAQAAATQAAYTQAVALQSGAIRSALDLGVIEGTRNLKYSVQGSSEIQPSEITDNGQFTALRFPNQRELPAIFAINPDGTESIVPFDVRDEFVVVHGVFAQLRLRRGKKVLCIFNDAPDFYGRDPKTGTASSIVERTDDGESN
ncbi:P-type conjugative transfer protein VirB9 [uncultured Parasphingorhabdus sp.]|uniref:P-type conjugative transfer protein VirB9 n=1 Tax=uncultured Parasphingorhabdus sp. TaxID=2709694 RepID=UPI0030DD6CA1|tara:strand:- start:1137 stop:1997 length:861 start_codon:yes stop_codon:yes gene_type:complete